MAQGYQQVECQVGYEREGVSRVHGQRCKQREDIGDVILTQRFLLGGLQIARRFIALLASLLIVMFVYRIPRASPNRTGVLVFARVAAVSLAFSWVLGWTLLIGGMNLVLIVAYVSAAVILFGSLVIVTTLMAVHKTVGQE